MTITNLLLAVFGMYLCVCRMAKMRGSTTKLTMRWRYTIYFAALLASAIGWTDTGWSPEWPQILLTAAVVADLVLGFHAWKDGIPDYARKDRACEHA